MKVSKVKKWLELKKNEKILTKKILYSQTKQVVEMFRSIKKVKYGKPGTNNGS